VLAVRQELVQDSWLTLLSGRDVVRNGIPYRDALFVWTRGRAWVDQQWLGQLIFYGLYVLGGIRLVLVAHVGALVGAAAVLVAAARRRGASSAAVFVAGCGAFLIAPWALQMRAQTIGQLLFAACLALLVDGGPVSRRRAVAVLALLCVWANVHGSVVLGALLVTVRGVTLLMSRRNRQLWAGVAFTTLAAPCVLVSPYGLDLVGYYHRLLANPLIPRFVDEWRWSTPSRTTALFYLALVAASVLAVRYRRHLTLFDKLAFLLLGAAAVQAVRSIIWFALAAVPLIAPLVDHALPDGRLFRSRLLPRAGTALALLAACAAAITFAHPPAWFLRSWPGSNAMRVAGVMAAHPRALLVADDRYADWLLWSQPSLRGRIAFDVRFELFTKAQFQALASRRRLGPRWQRAARPYSYLVYDPQSETCGIPNCRLLFSDSRFALARRG
jgi:hypothetical protein